jgi:hypothetical protein
MSSIPNWSYRLSLRAMDELMKAVDGHIIGKARRTSTSALSSRTEVNLDQRDVSFTLY